MIKQILILISILLSISYGQKVIHFNTASDCFQGCDFNDGSVWIGGVSPNNNYQYIASIDYSNSKNKYSQKIDSFINLKLAGLTIIGSPATSVYFTLFAQSDIGPAPTVIGGNVTFTIASGGAFGADNLTLANQASLILNSNCNALINTGVFEAGSLYTQDSLGSFDSQYGSTFEGTFHVANQTTVYLYGKNYIAGSFSILGETKIEVADIYTQAYFYDLRVTSLVQVTPHSGLFVTYDLTAPNIYVSNQGRLATNQYQTLPEDGSPIIVNIGFIWNDQGSTVSFGPADTITIGQVNSLGSVQFRGDSLVTVQSSPLQLQSNFTLFYLNTVNNADGSTATFNLNNTSIETIIPYTSTSAETLVLINYTGKNNQLGSSGINSLVNTTVIVNVDSTLSLYNSQISFVKNSTISLLPVSNVIIAGGSQVTIPNITVQQATLSIANSNLDGTVSLFDGGRLFFNVSTTTSSIYLSGESNAFLSAPLYISGGLYLTDSSSVDITVDQLATTTGSVSVAIQGAINLDSYSQLTITVPNAHNLIIGKTFYLVASHAPINIDTNNQVTLNNYLPSHLVPQFATTTINYVNYLTLTVIYVR
ncbi:hypothetical protein DFA_07815 [Cavenderia fasciculata]|uniref:Uncharacterized protein n=1 Tax=Cavenderia fasciculata TaxID=261658 RepID=F4Q3G8_CACFS|nr:uncharacterized protein DFA_07815 [Cavenderia fasciculata]EGG16837.1 hypothetical protein DFA_07815 [Cavenderia fasciculata]|eukprot:XP_004355311.1 hypothetical protein DFA_07815 [Cavenderia fasciculata]